MEKVIKVLELLGSEARSRSNAKRIRNVMDINSLNILDMEGVRFISRSFCDELCNIMDDFKGSQLCNVSQNVADMFAIVREGRKHERVRRLEDSEIKVFDDLESLSRFLATI